MSVFNISHNVLASSNAIKHDKVSPISLKVKLNNNKCHIQGDNKLCNEVRYYNISITIIVANFYFHGGRKFHTATYDKKSVLTVFEEEDRGNPIRIGFDHATTAFPL